MMMNKAFASAMLLTMLVGCGVSNSPITANVPASGVSAESVGVLPVRQVLTSKTIAEATTDVQKALDVRIPDAYTTVGGLSFEPTNQTNVLTFTGIETHFGFAFQYESQVAGTVNLNTGDVTTSSPNLSN